MTLKLYKEIMKYIGNQIELIECFERDHTINTEMIEHVLIRQLRKNLYKLSEKELKL